MSSAGATIRVAAAALWLIVVAGDGAAIALAIVFGLLYLPAGIAEQITSGDEPLGALPAMLIVASIGLTWLAAVQLFGPHGRRRPASCRIPDAATDD
jgi:hypothetical protein